MKIFAADHEFDYSWEEVSTANWRKYCPWNKESGHVLAVDTLSRHLDPKSGILRTERLITGKQNAPRWVTSFLGTAEVSYVYEVSYVTPPSPTEAQSGVQSASASQSPAPAQSTTSRTSKAQPEVETQQKSKTSMVKQAIWSQPAPQKRTSTSQTAAPQSQEQQGSDPTFSHIPAQPAIQSRPTEAAPPTTAPSSIALPSPPAHPGPRSPSVTMVSTNLTFADLILCRETVTYTPAPSRPDIHTGRTRFEQNARITAFCGGWAKVKERIEGFTVDRFQQNAERGRIGFEEVLETSRRVFGEEKERERAAARM